MECIAKIGYTVAIVEEPAQYYARSFCILEAFATIHADATYDMRIRMNSKSQIFAMLKKGADNVSVEEAQTRDSKDKLTIDEYIANGPGFAKVNAILQDEWK